MYPHNPQQPGPIYILPRTEEVWDFWYLLRGHTPAGKCGGSMYVCVCVWYVCMCVCVCAVWMHVRIKLTFIVQVNYLID